MKHFEIVKAVVFAMPLGIFTTFGLFLIVTIQMKVRKIDVIVRRLLIFYCLSAAIASLLLLFYYYLPDLFTYYDILYSLSVVFAIILFYHFLCFAIQLYRSVPFFHYVIPMLFFTGIYVCKLFLPVFWSEEGINILFIATLFWSIIYLILSFYQMYNYHLKLVLVSNTTETINKTIMRSFMIEIILFPATFVLMPFITKQYPGIILSVLMMLFILSALWMNIPLTYAMIRYYGSSVNKRSLFVPFVLEMTPTLVVSDPVTTQAIQSAPSTDSKIYMKRVYRKYYLRDRSNNQLIEINKKSFEHYFKKHKPYLNPDLKINDLVAPLQSNRTYISKFINHAYQMSFSSYINRCRLKEMERLLRLARYKGKTPNELIDRTGFGNYRNYLRTKQQFGSADEDTNKHAHNR